MTAIAPEAKRRQYDSTLRQQRAFETRDRIVAAGCELLGESSIRDWRGLTMRGVSVRAGVNERTVYATSPMSAASVSLSRMRSRLA